MNNFGILHFAEEQVRNRVAGIQIGGVEEAPESAIIRTQGLPTHAERDQHACGMREQAITFGQDFDGRLRCVMQQQLCPPVEQIGFGRVQFCRVLVLSNGFERIAQFLRRVRQRMMEFGISRVMFQ